MQNENVLVENSPRIVVRDLVQDLGVWRVLHLLLSVVISRRERMNHVADLSDRMRRDIGLPVEWDILRPPKRSLWDLTLDRSQGRFR